MRYSCATCTRAAATLALVLCLTPIGAAPQAADPLPLQPTRRLQFTATEGTWLSLDVTPDGRTIVFDLLGDLYTLPIGGGTASRITSGMAFDAQPRVSPDGRRIVFVSDRNGSDNVWIADIDGGNARQITHDERTFFISPEWTPDGDYLVVSKSMEIVNRPRNYQLFLYHRDGGQGVQLTGARPGVAEDATHDPRPQALLGAAFGADGRYIYTSATGGGGWGSWEVTVVDRRDGRTFQQTHAIESAMRPTLSGDGRWLAYATRRDGVTQWKVVETASGDERTLVRAADRDDQEGSFTRDLLPGASFTPDSRAFVAAYGGKIWRVDVATGDAVQVPFTANVDGGLGPLARFEYPSPDSLVTARRVEQPALSPDGRSVAFSAVGRLWIQAPDGGVARQLSVGDDGAFFPAWSPDGRWIAYVTWNDLEGGDIWRVRGDGSGRPERLTSAKAFYEKLAWSPDGRRIVAARGPRQQRIEFFDELRTGRSQVTELVSIPSDGGAARTIVPVNTIARWSSMHFGVPHFGPDTSRLYYTDPFDGLISVRWDGSDRRTLLKVTGWEWTRNPQVMADEILLSPTGQRALILMNNQAYLAELPAAGDRIPAVSLTNLSAAPFPIRRLTTAGADFIGWSADGRSYYWTLGHSLFRGDVASGGQNPARSELTVRLPRDVPKGTVVLRGARVITMKGHDVIPNADVVITNDRITAVGRRGSVPVPSGARTIDVSGKTIIPGYVDIHAHMWAPWGVHRTQVWEYLANLAYGITSTRDPQTMTADVITYADRVATGDILGPRIYTTARGIFSSEDTKSLDDARDVARRYAEFYNTETIKNYLVGDRKHRQWLMMAATEFHLTPTAEATADFKMNLTLPFDGFAGQEHSFPVAQIYNDVAQLMARSDITYTPTLLINYGAPASENRFYRTYDIHADAKIKRFLPHEEIDRRVLRRAGLNHESQFVVREEAAVAAKILAAGGRVGLGGHGQLQGLGVHWELQNFALGGMSPHDVLRVATIYGAEAIGHGKDFGSIEAGKLADLQILDRNPLDDIANTQSIRQVMINGRLFDASTMNEVWPRQRALSRQWWWSDGKE